MTHHLYALLVGINKYDSQSPVPPLQGCTNDAKAMQAYLEARVASRKTQLHTEILLDEQATRQAVIDGFREHLQQANEGDTVLFYYAGHGSQNRAPEEFWPMMPSRLNETLVCYDSRTPNSWDIADKELSKLIAEVGKQKPHITIVLDCCHSGSGTRSDDSIFGSVFAKRKTLIDERDRLASSFLISAQELEQVEKETLGRPMLAIARSLDSANSGWHLPQGRHVLMAACRDTEEASEYQADGQPCGAFSHFLLDTLQKTNSPLTYRDLFNATSTKTQANVSAQAPQIEAPYLEDLEQLFLGGLVDPFPAYFTLAHSSPLGWYINGGAVHGIQSPVNHETTQLALFSIEAQPEDMHQLRGAILVPGSFAIANATVTHVQPQLSQITTAAKLDPGLTYKAIITYLPVPPLNVVLEGDTHNLEQLRQAVQTSTTAAASSSYFKETADIASAEIRVVANSSEYIIERVQDFLRPIATVATTAQPQAGAADSADTVVRLLAHIARWTGITELAPPPGNQLPMNTVELQIYYKDQLLEAEQIQLAYERQAQQWRSPRFKAKLINHSDRPLYCTLLNLTEEYSVSAPFFSSGGTWLEAHSEIWVTVADSTQLSDLIPTTVPQQLWEQGVSEYQDRLKLIASTAEFDPTVLLQSKINSTGAVTHRSISPSKNGLFRQFASQVTSRDIGTTEAVETVDLWTTSQRLITTIRPQPDIPLSAAGTISLTATDTNRSVERIAIRPHAQLKAKARLISSAQATRTTSIPSLPPLLREQTQPLLFAGRRSVASSLDALELREIEGADSVTPNHPLTLVLDAPLAPGESVLPVAYDGEFFIPLGYGRRRGEQTEVVLQRLPQLAGSEPSGLVTPRSIGSALRIIFRKFAAQTLGETLSQKLGISFEYPILASVEKKREELTYTTDASEVRDRVAKAKNIVIYIHGLIGSTPVMVSTLQAACIDGSGQACSTRETYDLVLAYDYESLNTSVAISAVQLKQRLAAVGIVPGHTKTVHIVAHSMGGLISRWLIEKEGGGELVQHLTMLGTPNAGSPWPVVQAGLFKALSFAINELSSVVWPLRLVKAVLTTLEAADITLDEMMPNSDLLTLLAASEPPIPYSIVAGNTSLMLPDKKADEKATLRTRLERKINQLVEFPFLKEANDVAVLVSSIRDVPKGRSAFEGDGRSPSPQVCEVACNHVSYFIDPAGLAGLSWAVDRAFAVTKQPL